MTPKARMKPKDKKIQTVVMLEQGELTFLDRKIEPTSPDLNSRSAVIRRLIRRAMEKGEI